MTNPMDTKLNKQQIKEQEQNEQWNVTVVDANTDQRTMKTDTIDSAGKKWQSKRIPIPLIRWQIYGNGSTISLNLKSSQVSHIYNEKCR